MWLAATLGDTTGPDPVDLIDSELPEGCRRVVEGQPRGLPSRSASEFERPAVAKKVRDGLR
jgi:hypothetical protein